MLDEAQENLPKQRTQAQRAQDLTVHFVCDPARLKLSNFGIAANATNALMTDIGRS
ncbi:hypothetical protein [Parasedimentitalea denitrificans]|uniref:hypothetical protein n=1 Tax=Parasedimentitalea denitrificans TaxID=2211118 RepID=UPI0014309FA5|nr:hypothetical protein [Sedimentitalea sp. CY04]